MISGIVEGAGQGNKSSWAGYEVRSTLNPIEAIEIAREFQPHVALVGLLMPQMDGIELGLELTKVLPRTKVVIMTQSEPIEIEQELLRELRCPFDNLSWRSRKEELLEKIPAGVHEARFFDLATGRS